LLYHNYLGKLETGLTFQDKSLYIPKGIQRTVYTFNAQDAKASSTLGIWWSEVRYPQIGR